MLPHLRILNSRDRKRIFQELSGQFGDIGRLDYVFLMNNKDKIYLLSRAIEEIDIKKLRINNLGLYFGKKEKDGIRLSIEGAQLINPTKNVIELSEKQVDLWMRGEDIDIESDSKGYVIVKSGKDIFGCGRYKEGRLQNMVSKSRRIKQGAREPEF